MNIHNSHVYVQQFVNIKYLINHIVLAYFLQVVLLFIIVDKYPAKNSPHTISVIHE